MIYLTGDIHHTSLKTFEHLKGLSDETKYIPEYIKILDEHKVKATFFVTGKALEENSGFWKEIQDNYRIEIAAHGYSAFDFYPFGLGFLFRMVSGCAYGPRFMQKKDIQKTVSAMKKAGIKPCCWRTHEYQSNKNTRSLLAKNSFEVISDRWDFSENPNILNYTMNNKSLLDVPITIPTDHMFIKHDKKDVRKGVQPPEIWLELAKKLVRKQQFSVFQLHPACMKYIDDFETLTKLCEWIVKTKQNTGLLSSVLK